MNIFMAISFSSLPFIGLESSSCMQNMAAQYGQGFYECHMTNSGYFTIITHSIHPPCSYICKDVHACTTTHPPTCTCIADLYFFTFTQPLAITQCHTCTINLHVLYRKIKLFAPVKQILKLHCTLPPNWCSYSPCYFVQ